MDDKKYDLALDIGTTSIGFAATDDHYQLVRAKGKNIFGVRLFDEGQTAAERRGFRTTRRRLNRRKYRLSFLNQLFEPYIAEQDPTFFRRLKESNLSPLDSKKNFEGSLLFPERTDKDFYTEYPTMYHLRYHLMNDQRQFDLREVYLAMHHILKSRGNFLNETPTNRFKIGELNLKEKVEQLNDLFSSLAVLNNFNISITDLPEFKKNLQDQRRNRRDRVKLLIPMMYTPVTDKELAKQQKEIATVILNAILGLKADFSKFTDLALTAAESKDWKLSFNSVDFDEKLTVITEQLDDTQLGIIEVLNDTYMQVTFQEILAFDSPEVHQLPGDVSLSKAMMGKYTDHRDQLALLKQLRHDFSAVNRDDIAKSLKLAYSRYIEGDDKKKATRDKFYKEIKTVLASYQGEEPQPTNITEAIQKISALIGTETFMLKQRSNANGAIPYQVQQIELDAIIENQAKYYPWLATPNPVEKQLGYAPYKLDLLINFRVPYYVGPMVEKQNPETGVGSPFAWMIRKESGNITPYNFEQKVDTIKSAEQFIKRMTLKDTILFTEDVVPDNSLLYQRYKVLNELNMVRINEKKINVETKQAIYNKLFMNFKTISIRRLQDFLVTESYCKSRPKISGLADEKAFLNGLTTYYDFKQIFGQLVDQNDKQEDFERIIEWSTIFEDKEIFRQKLTEIKWLDGGQRKRLADKRRYSGWGRLSRKLLTDIRNGANKSIMDQLWDTNDNFMKIKSEPEYVELIQQENSQALQEAPDPLSLIDDLYTSPANKKAIRQIFLVVNDIIKARGGQQPEHVFIEFPRGASKNPHRSTPREDQIRQHFKQVTNDFITESINRELKENISEHQNFNRDKLFLYFLQAGRSVYSREKLDIDQLDNYHIDHIVPQATVKDDSLNNRVLVTGTENTLKGRRAAKVVFGDKMSGTWKQMLDAHLITQQKYDNLMTDPDQLNEYQRQGFVKRQLVETQQITKNIADLLDSYYPDIKVVTVRASLTHQMREEFDLPKNRDVNDYHHAQDAYLASFVGNYLMTEYPNLRRFFVYGEFKINKKNNGEFDLRRFNFLHGLKEDKRIIDKETGEIVAELPDLMNYVRKIFMYKTLLISRDVYIQRGNLFKQTIFKASDDKASGQGGKQLIPLKEDKPTAIYGGYTNKQTAYMAIVRVVAGKKITYKFAGVPVTALGKLETVEAGSAEEIRLLHEILLPEFTKVSKAGKTSITEFEIVIPKVYWEQLILDNGVLFRAGGTQYRRNAKQMVLSNKSVKAINKTLFDKDNYSIDKDNQSLIDAYDEIVGFVEHNLPLFDVNKFRQKLKEGRAQFIPLPIETTFKDKKKTEDGKRQILIGILQGLHNDGKTAKLGILGIKTDFGKLQFQNQLISEEAYIIYQSPSGLFERRLQIKDIE